MHPEIKIIAFDADDTLWVNEPYFQDAERQFSELLESYLSHHDLSRELLSIEIANLPLYGYGVKGFVLSMVETALMVSEKTISLEAIDKMLTIGKNLLNQPIELLDGVEEVLHALQGKYKLVMATKGDLLDQERKLNKSGLAKYFHHIEIVSEKKLPEYQKLLRHLDVPPESFLMIGNSLKSDIMPVLELGGWGYHVPYHTTWAYEKVEHAIQHPRFQELGNIREVLELLK